MNTDPDNPNVDRVEARRLSDKPRRLSPGRRIYYFLGRPALSFVLRLLWRSYRVEKILGADVAAQIIDNKTVCAPCYWHQHTLLSLMMMRDWIRRGFNAGFVITPSVDGEVPERIARSWGAKVIRGSSSSTGAQAMRQMYTVMKLGNSIVSAADGSQGPKYKFQLGVVLMSRIGCAPIIPIASAADRAWHLSSRWDDFVIPKPFARVVLAVGSPRTIPSSSTMTELEEHRAELERVLVALGEDAREAL